MKGFSVPAREPSAWSCTGIERLKPAQGIQGFVKRRIFFFKQLGLGRAGLNERLQKGITDAVKLMTGKLYGGKCLQ